MSTVDLDVANAAVDGDVSDVQEVNDRLAGPPAGAVDSARALCGLLDADNWPILSPLETALHRRWTSEHRGYSALQRPVDYKQDLFTDAEQSLAVPGATTSFETTEIRDVVVYWSITYSSIKQSPRFTSSTDVAANHFLFLHVDGEQLDDSRKRLPISYGAWAINLNSNDVQGFDGQGVCLSRGRTWTGHRLLKNLAAGEHSVGLGVWIRGHGTVRVHSAQIWALVRRQ